MTLVDLPASPVAGRNLIGGAWEDSQGATIEVRTPYNRSVMGHVPDSSPTDVQKTVAKAQAVTRQWATTPLKERCGLLFKLRELMLRDLDVLSHRAAAECGKTVGEARAGVLKGIEVLEYATSLQNLDQGGAMEVSRGVQCVLRREPLGVVAGITPFNFPAMVPMWQIPLALATGNCFVHKPSEKVPLTAQLLGELILEAGFPKGTYSIVNGGKQVVEALIDAPEVKAVAFVGSSAVAHAVHQRASTQGKRALALGGAKNNLLVVPDAEPQMTIDGVVSSFTGCAGQRCMAASLMIAVGDVDHLIEGIKKRAAEMTLGTDMGAIIDSDAKDRIVGHIAAAQKDGAKLLLDGRDAAAPKGYEEGCWLGPTIIDHASIEMPCATTEIFGPVLTIVRVPTLEDALALERNNAYGNATSVFTSRGAVAQRVATESTAGMIGVNIGVPVPREPFSFGGTKQSRFGHGDITGAGGVDFWTSLKKITSKWGVTSDANWMS